MDNEKPTIETLKLMLSQKGKALEAMLPAVHSLIKRWKMPYKVIQKGEEYDIVEVGDSTDAWLSRFITVNQKMIELKADVKKLAAVNDDKDQLHCVLITGPTGTGKELIALALHGDRVGKFVPINCAGLPSELVESELFGHLSGAFTSANKTKEGMLAAASKGTLFLDEIGELPLPAQAKLLRAIQSRKIRKVGAITDEDVDCRIVCATHRKLKEMCSEDRFRTDLYARISTFELKITSLERRHEDIIPICESIEGGKEFIAAFIKERPVFDWNLDFNVRSLQQMIKRYKVLGRLPEY